MQIVEGSKRKYKAPQWWNKALKIIPDLRPNLLTDIILSSKTLTNFFKSIPNACPFDRSYVLMAFSKEILIYFCPPLCKLNPFYEYIIDVKLEIMDQEKFAKEATFSRLTDEDSLALMQALITAESEEKPLPSELKKIFTNAIDPSQGN